jgi:phage terminase large subunit-like protein
VDDRILCEACRVCLFFETQLTLTGDYSGQAFLLYPEIKRILRDVFGTLDDEGNRQYREVFLEMPTSNAKTSIGAGLVLCFLGCATTSGTEVYSAATARKQAGITFNLANQMVRQSADLTSRFVSVPSTRRIYRRDDPTCFYEALSADGDVNDGMAPSFVLRDELHRWRTRKQLELNDVLERKMGKRKNPLIWDITTSGEQDESPLCWRRHEYAREIEAGTFKNPRFYGRIFAADPVRIEKDDDYWKSREAAVVANPAHEDRGGHLKHSVFEDYIAKAAEDPVAKSNYLRFNLGYWGNTDEAAIDYAIWKANGGPCDITQHPEYDPELVIERYGLRGRTCYAGIDAAWTTDLTAVVFVFPPEEREPWKVLPFFFMPSKHVKKREQSDKVPYGEWAARHFITAIPGPEIDMKYLKDKILWGDKMFDLREVCYDRYGFRQEAKDLDRAGLITTEIPQKFEFLSRPSKKLLAIYKEENGLWHGNHPVLNFNARCLRLQGDRKDNIQPSKPERQKTSKRIDGIAAMITAMSRAELMEPVQTHLVEYW